MRSAHRILLVAYYFEPFKGVGGMRMSYWANAFAQESLLNCTVITATPQDSHRENVFFVEDPKASLFDKFIQGYSWSKAIQLFLDSHKEFEFDHVIISGGPFGHFGVSKYLKRKYDCKILLDFRDPFSRNSRFKTFFLKDFIKEKFERYFLNLADHVITVNEYCKNLISAHIEPQKVTIIENGYNDQVVDHVSVRKFSDSDIHVVYAGSFYDDRNPDRFVKTLTQQTARDSVQYFFHHIGQPSKFLEPFHGSKNVIEHGLKSYNETIEIMKKCSAGLIVTSGEPMESTTKVYDYIGCDLNVIIVTSGEPHTGSLESVTQKIKDRVYWTKNDESSINALFKKIKNQNEVIPGKKEFSRRHGFHQLKELLNTI